MKTTILTLLGCALMALPSVAAEKRTYTSADGKSSFEGTLLDYNAEAGTVKIRRGARTLHFKMDILSDEDQTYIKEEGPKLVAGKAIRIDFDLWNGERKTSRTDNSRTTTSEAGYEIELRNWTKKDVNDIEVRYTIFHRKDAENGPGSIAQTKGSYLVSTLFANSYEKTRTDPVTLTRYIRQKSGGG